MRLGHVVFRSPDQLITADDIAIDWSPLQFFSKGVAISQLQVASLSMQTLRDSAPAKMPVNLAPPFALDVANARIAKVTVTGIKATVGTVLTDVRFTLHGDARQWLLRDASALTPFGRASVNARIGAGAPFALDARASLSESQPASGQQPAQLNLHASGNLSATLLVADARSGAATGDARFTLAPFEPVPLRAMTINGRGIDPGFFNPALPGADLSIAISAQIGADRALKGSIALDNRGLVGTIDQQRLPLRAMRGTLSGNLGGNLGGKLDDKLGANLAALRISDVLVDFGAAGTLTGSGSIARTPADSGIGTAEFALHTDRLDLKRLHSKMKSTKIAGDITLANAGTTQTLNAHLLDSGMRLDARASLADQLLTLNQARLVAGSSQLDLSGTASLAGTQTFNLRARAARFNPAAFGDYPAADLNAELHAAGQLTPKWNIVADVALRPSRLFGQPLSGKARFDANALHVSDVAANIALGQNTLDLRGAFGAPGERLLWKFDGKQLSAARSDLYGALNASGAVSGSLAAPRTTFVIDATNLGWAAALRKADNGVLQASGEVWLLPLPTAAAVGGAARTVEFKTRGSARRFNPAAFGAPLPGSINGAFDASAHLGPDWRGTLNVALQPSTLSKAPLSGSAKLTADARHVSNADIDLHLGENLLNARGSFGAARDQLDWRIDASQLSDLGPGFGGAIKGSGTLSGSLQAPALTLALDGQNLKLPGSGQLKSLRASASVGSGQGAADALVSDIALAGYASGDTRIASARLQTNGTRGAHSLRLSARGDSFDALVALRGNWNANAWSGSVDQLQNSGRYAFTLQAPAPLRIAGAPGAGVLSLARPEQIALGGAVLRLPEGSINVQSLQKSGARWTSSGAATGVPLNYLAQFSTSLRDTLAGDLTLGAQWSLDLQGAASAGAGAAPAVNGMLHVFREKGDLIAGAEVPVVLGLRQLDARADVRSGALRMQVELDGTRAGRAKIDATARMLDGRLGNDSPLTLSASADMTSIAWLAPLSGQPALELDGTLKLNLSGTGTVGAPSLNGSISGDKLALSWAEQGVKLARGELRAQLAGDQLLLQRLSFEGAQGRASADGTVRFAGGEASMNLTLIADKLEVLSRPDRTVVVSGQSTLVRDAKRFTLNGKFRADRALIELAPQGRPTLSSDVIVLGRDKAALAIKEAPSMPLSVDIEADLGEAFRLRGMGADAELAGTVRFRAAGARAPRANGTIRVVSGTYAAYGQKLSIERGVLTFSGPLDNPALNILAVRKRPDGEQLTETNVEAGVEVRGTALAPAAKLVSTPSVPDSEKLSWLVLGHGMEGTSGNEAGMLSAAAGALLGGSGGGFQSRLANSLGVDELGLAQAKGLESTVVTVGKRISARAYLSFEQGATTASSLVKLRYKLNPRITLQLQTGTNTAFDVLYSWAFD